MATQLNTQELVELVGLLHRRREELREEIREEIERLGEEQYRQLAGEVHDMEDVALANLLTEMNHTEINRHRHELDEVQAALNRIGEGTYGICTECGNDIGFARLRVQPTAKRCVRCQEAQERAQRGVSSLAL